MVSTREGLVASPQQTSRLQLVVFRLGEESYGVEISQVHEIVAVPPITPIPRAPEFVEGVINLRGRVVPVVDLRRCLGMAPAERTRATRIVITTVGEHPTGLIADAVTQVLTIDRGQIEPPAATVLDGGADYIRGIAKVDGRMIVWADLGLLLSSRQRADLDSAELLPASPEDVEAL